MKTKKTKWGKRGTYTFQFDDGTSITLRPGEDGVTEADIKVLHSLDDAEVYNNIKNSRPPMTESEKAEKKRWEAEHPGERYPANWNLSFDYMAGDDGDEDKLDKSRIFSETCTYMETEDETEKEMLDRILWFLTDIQREVYRLVKMVEDALAGRIDLIITKSVSRFARNTVDSLTTIRKLKESGTECYFEKENIWTFDGKGELLLTIMSSLAQEESRSISENCTWGQRKRFQDGKVTVPFKRFLGYDRGEDGNLVVNEEQAVIVRRIYGLFLQGKTPYAIARQLTEEGIPTPGGKKNWGKKTVESILTNEKYKGDALLQKVYTTDFLTKKKKKNEGEVPQYYVEGNHEAIIPPAQFDRVQKEMQRRCGDTDRHGCVSIFSSKIRCGDCGGFYGSKVWHSNDKYRKVIWRCNHKYDDGKQCSTPHLDEDTIKALYLKALRILGEERDEIIATFESIKDEMYDTTDIEKEQAALQEEVMVVTEMVEQCISENAHVAQNQKDYQKKYNVLSDRYDRTKERLDKVSGRIMERQAKREMIEAFLRDLAEMDEDVQEFTDDLWFNLLDHVTVFSKKDVMFTFKNGTEIRVK